MELNRTPNELDRNARNKENENWDKIEGNLEKIGNSVNDFIGTVTSEVVNELVDKAKLDWKEPVNNFNSLPTNAEVGETRMTKDNGNVYRYNGTDWEYIQQIDAGPVNELDSRLTSQLNETAQDLDETNNNVQNLQVTKANETDVRKKDVKIEPEDFSVNTLGLITGEGTIDIKSIPQDESVTPNTLTNDYRFRGLQSGVDVNTLTKDGVYTVLSSSLNIPESATMLLMCERYGSRFVQIIRRLDNPSMWWVRCGDVSNIANIQWVKQPVLSSNSITNSMLQNKSVTNSKLSDNYDYDGTITSGNLNTMTKTGRWLLSGTNFENVPVSNTSAYLTVKNYGNFITQTFTLFNDASQSYHRIIKADNTVHQDWSSPNNGLPLEGKVIVDFGDSILGNTQGADSVSSNIAKRTGAIVHNCGFGGCRMSRHNDWWDAFSMYRLADAITSGDWSLQDQALIDGRDPNLNPGNTLPFYFANTLPLLKSIDFNEVDYINIEYGTNDYTASKLVDNPTDPYDVDTYAGALRYSLELIMEKFPHLKIMIWTPTYRFWRDSEGNFIEDSDTKIYNQSTLIDFAEKAKEVAREYKTPYIDNYSELGINKFNREYYFSGDDSTHPNTVGNAKIGHKVGSALISNY